MSAVCCQVEAFAKGRSLVQRSPTACEFVTVCDHMQQQPLHLKRLGRNEDKLIKKATKKERRDSIRNLESDVNEHK